MLMYFLGVGGRGGGVCVYLRVKALGRKLYRMAHFSGNVWCSELKIFLGGFWRVGYWQKSLYEHLLHLSWFTVHTGFQELYPKYMYNDVALRLFCLWSGGEIIFCDKKNFKPVFAQNRSLLTLKKYGMH